MSSSQTPVRVDGLALKKVHDLLKKDIGAVHNLFSTGPKPNTHNIKDLTDDTAALYTLDTESKTAALFLFSLARVKGTETAEYTSFLNILRHPCPKPPSDGDGAFLPYLSFLCTPDRKKVVRDDRLIDGKQYDPNDKGLIMPPHPQGVERPAPPQRNAYKELSTMLSRAGDCVDFATFAAIMKDVDRGVSTAEAKRLFTEGFIHGKASGKMDEKTTVVPVASLLEVCRPQLTMERQKTRSSSLVKGAFTWDVPSPPTPTSTSARSGSKSPRNSSTPANGGTFGGSSSRSSSNSSARKGFQPTRSAVLRQQLAQEQLNDPSCPYYSKGIYKHIPAVPESHYKKQSQLGLTSRYSPRNSPRRASASGAGDTHGIEAAASQRQKAQE